MLDKNTINNEMMVHIAMCTHKEPKKVLVINGENFKDELSKYDASVIFSESLNSDNKFDLIIYNKNDIDDMTMANIDRNLEQFDGILVVPSSNFSDDGKLLEDVKNIGKNFWISMPFRFENQIAILASKKYHPQADIILDRSDFVEASYYNTELHNASFVMPTYIQKSLTGIAKR